MNSICKVLIKAMFLVVYTAESSFSTKHCFSERCIHQNTFLTKPEQTIDMTEYLRGRASSAAKLNVLKCICNSRTVEETRITLNNVCPNPSVLVKAYSRDGPRETANKDCVVS